MLRQYVACLEMARAQTVHRVRSFVAPEGRLVTPLGEATGPRDFADLMGRVHACVGMEKIKVVDVALAIDNPHCAIIKWDMLVKAGFGSLVISGCSDLTFDMKDDKIVHQHDIWDPTPVYRGSSFLLNMLIQRASGRMMK